MTATAISTLRIASRLMSFAVGCALLVGCNDSASRTTDSVRTTGQSDSSASVPVAKGAPTSLRIGKVNATDTVEIGGDWNSAAESSVWSAYAFQGKIVRMQESSRDTSESPFVREYHFDGRAGVTERLAHYVEDRSQLAASGNASPSVMRVRTEVQWPANAPAVATRQVDGSGRPVQPWDLENIQRHAEQLLSLARPGIPRR